MGNNKHFYWLDWMRFIAAFMVVICHSRGYNWVEWGSLAHADQTPLIKSFFAATRAGLEWVIVFFVLSGFLVGGGVISRCLKGTFDLRLFAIDRISRIWVPLIPALILTLGVANYCELPASFWDLLGNAFALQGVFFKNFGHNEPLWSLSYEVWFYVLIGSVGVIVTPTSRNRVLALLMMFIGYMVFTRLSPNFLNCWLLGAFSYFLVSERKRSVILILALALAFLGAAISQFQSETLSISRNVLISLLPSRHIATLIESTGIGLLIASICRIQPTSKLMITVEKAGTILAAFSYTLYLTHYPILNLWEHFVPERSPSFTAVSFAIFIAKICSCLLVGWLLYLPFEANTSRVRAWIRERFIAS
jgi:peptidoglycan/LPS O-acetylase OafA/YrhL